MIGLELVTQCRRIHVALHFLHRARSDANDCRGLQNAGARSKLLADASLDAGADLGATDGLAGFSVPDRFSVLAPCSDASHAGLYPALDNGPFELGEHAQHA